MEVDRVLIASEVLYFSPLSRSPPSLSVITVHSSCYRLHSLGCEQGNVMSSSGASCFPLIYWSSRATGNPDFLLFLWPKGVQNFFKNWVNKVKSKTDPERPIKSTKTIYILTCEHALMGSTVRFYSDSRSDFYDFIKSWWWKFWKWVIKF